MKNESENKPIGNVLMSWEVDEYHKHDRSLAWYIIVSVVAVGLIIYALMTANFLFAVVILMIGIISFLSGMRHPNRVEVHITDNGAQLGSIFTPYKEMKDFSVVYDPPEVKTLYLDFKSALRPMMSIPLEDVDPNTVREALLPFVLEDLERTEETLTDLASRLYKI